MGIFNELRWFRKRRSGGELSNGRLVLSLTDDLRTETLCLIVSWINWNTSYFFFVQVLFRLGFADNWTLKSTLWNAYKKKVDCYWMSCFKAVVKWHLMYTCEVWSCYLANANHLANRLMNYIIWQTNCLFIVHNKWQKRSVTVSATSQLRDV